MKIVCIKVRYLIEPRDRIYVKNMDFYPSLKTWAKV